MEKEKKIISKKNRNLIIVGVLIVLYVSMFGIYHKVTTPCSDETKSENGMINKSTTTVYSDTWKVTPKKSNVSYEINYGKVNNVVSYLKQKYYNVFVKSQSELQSELYKAFGSYDVTVYDENENQMQIGEKFDEEFFKKHNLAIEMHCSFSEKVSIVSVVNNNSIAKINEKEEFDGDANYVYVIEPKITFIALDKDVKEVDFDVYRTTITRKKGEYIPIFIFEGIVLTIIVIIIVILIILVYNQKIESNLNEKKQSETKKIIRIITIIALVFIALCSIFWIYVEMSISTIAHKPIIYLYPKEATEITAELGYPEKITCSYPKYTTGWQVLARPNGDLIDLNTKRNLYSLYYESSNVVKFKVEKDGFIVKGTDVAEFLEDKLALLGLNEREAEEFIVYWLPKLQENKYNYIRFATMEEINENMPLKFSTEPDSLIRVLMTYKGLKNPIKVQEQKLKTPERNGFVAVEWGGTEIN